MREENQPKLFPRQQRLRNQSDGKTRVCNTCNVEKPAGLFRTSSFHNPFGKICSDCHSTPKSNSTVASRYTAVCPSCGCSRSKAAMTKEGKCSFCVRGGHYLDHSNPKQNKSTKSKSSSDVSRKDVRKLEYDAYMGSKAWRDKRREYWDSELMRECYFCGRPWENFKGMELHHRTYERFQQEHLEDLVPLCPTPCHSLVTREWNAVKKLQVGVPQSERVTLWEMTELCKVKTEKQV